MSAPHIILDRLPSLCQKLSDLVEVWRSYNKNNFACFLLRHGAVLQIIYVLSYLLKCGTINATVAVVTATTISATITMRLAMQLKLLFIVAVK